MRNAARSCGKQAVRMTIATAPTTVPIMRYQPLRSDAPKMRLTDDRRRGAGPIGAVKLEPERDVKSETDRSPQPQPEQQRRAGRPRRVRRLRLPSGSRTAIRRPLALADSVRHSQAHPFSPHDGPLRRRALPRIRGSPESKIARTRAAAEADRCMMYNAQSESPKLETLVNRRGRCQTISPDSVSVHRLAINDSTSATCTLSSRPLTGTEP